MKIFKFLLIGASFALLLCGCTAKKLSPTKTIGGEPKDTEEVTAEHQLVVDLGESLVVQDTDSTEQAVRDKSYANFYGQDMSILAADDTGEIIDFAKFISLAGLDYNFHDDGFTIFSSAFSDATTFIIEVRFNDASSIVGGSTLYLGRSTGDGWDTVVDFNSATDVIYSAVLGDHSFLIGADEMDYLWREVRLLTAPADKADEINAAIDAELASYWVE